MRFIKIINRKIVDDVVRLQWALLWAQVNIVKPQKKKWLETKILVLAAVFRMFWIMRFVKVSCAAASCGM